MCISRYVLLHMYYVSLYIHSKPYISARLCICPTPTYMRQSRGFPLHTIAYGYGIHPVRVAKLIINGVNA